MAALLLSSVNAFPPAGDHPELAPNFRGQTLDGERFSAETLRGKVVLIQFWATWCHFCRGDQPAVDAVARDYKSRGLVVLAVNVGESKSKVKRYLKESPRECNVVAAEDSNLPAMFPSRGFPLYVLIDRDGRVVGKQPGAGGENALRQLLTKAGLEPE